MLQQNTEPGENSDRFNVAQIENVNVKKEN